MRSKVEFEGVILDISFILVFFGINVASLLYGIRLANSCWIAHRGKYYECRGQVYWIESEKDHNFKHTE